MEQKGKFILLNRDEFKNWLFSNTFSREITFIQNHHTWKPNYSSFKNKNYFTLLQNMEAYHVGLKWGQIAQNITTFPDGIIAICRSFDIRPTCIANKNQGGLCIENLGNFDKDGDKMTEEHKTSIIWTNALLCVKFRLNPDTDDIVYHHWYSPKSCPGNNFFGGNTREDAQKNFLPLVMKQIQEINKDNVLKGTVFVHPKDKLNVRSGPGAQYAILRALEKGEEVIIKDIKNGWYKISDSDEWVSGKFVKFNT
ncbi:MAG: amidase [Chlorobi bacterium]|nr:amidase [Chlorobiota bacterium]